jgi:hypothetical protein
LIAGSAGAQEIRRAVPVSPKIRRAIPVPKASLIVEVWIADAHREDGKRFVMHADEKLTADKYSYAL